ncbi:hypothetical protein DWY49_07435 [Roseburia sp. AF25-25LB]|nr:hypothetical protein DWY49_07435 [Roseburia sp. AF25-25LB]
MVLPISTTKFFLAEISLGDYNSIDGLANRQNLFCEWQTNLQATGTTHNNEKCNGTGLVLKICETKNNVWKRCRITIQNSIDNHIEIT